MILKVCASILIFLLQHEWVYTDEVWTWDHENGRQDHGRSIFLDQEDYADSYDTAASHISDVVIFPADDEEDVMLFPTEEEIEYSDGTQEGRFLGIGKGIRCSLGIGSNCQNNRKVQKPNNLNQFGNRPKPQSSFFPTENNQAQSPYRFGSPVQTPQRPPQTPQRPPQTPQRPPQIPQRPSPGVLDSISSALSSILPSFGQQNTAQSEPDRAYTSIKQHPYKVPQSSLKNPKPSFSVHKPTFAHQKPAYHPKPTHPPKPHFKPSYNEPKPSYYVDRSIYAEPSRPTVTIIREPTYVVQPTYVQAHQIPTVTVAASQIHHAPIHIQQQIPTVTVAASQIHHAPIHIQQQPHTYIAAVPAQAVPTFQPAPVVQPAQVIYQTVTRVAAPEPVINNRNDVFGSSGNDLLSQATLYRESIDYLEDCHCVPYDSCSTNDVIGRSLNVDPSNVIDARNSEKNSIESNATDTNMNETITPMQDHNKTNNSTTNTINQDPDLNQVLENSTTTRRKRSEDDINESFNVQGRQLNGFTPGQYGCGDGYVCCRRPVYKPKPRYQCGLSNGKGLLQRVKNPYHQEGDTEFGEYPWHAAILKRENNAVNYVCGAVLIDDRHVLTAAHCIDGLLAENLKVRLGEWDVANKDEFFAHLELQVSAMYINQQYTKGTLENDIAMMRLGSIVDFNSNPHISPVCLPNKFTGFRQNGCMVTGWGKDAFDTKGKFQHVLKQVSLPLIEHYQCQNALRSTRLGPGYSLHEGMICAGGEESKDACKGDGGSPLACASSDGSYQLAGLVSWGIGCGQRGIPGVYVNVRHYLDWIKSIQNYN